MKAFKVHWSDKHRAAMVGAACRYYLPSLECLVCTPEWKNWGYSSVGYPAFKFDFLNKKQFNLKSVVSLEQFNEIRERIACASGRRVMVVPGASIGELEGTATSTKLDDFIWGRVVLPDISKRAREILAAEGIELITAECSILCRGKIIDTHLTVQYEPVALLTEESLDRHKIFHCPRCGNYQSPLKPDPVVPEGIMIKRSAWPKGGHLVQTIETLNIIASEHFMEVVKKYNLTGITFVECGQYV